MVCKSSRRQCARITPIEDYGRVRTPNCRNRSARSPQTQPSATRPHSDCDTAYRTRDGEGGGSPRGSLPESFQQSSQFDRLAPPLPTLRSIPDRHGSARFPTRHFLSGHPSCYSLPRNLGNNQDYTWIVVTGTDAETYFTYGYRPAPARLPSADLRFRGALIS
jgi:hypothetical protein